MPDVDKDLMNRLAKMEAALIGLTHADGVMVLGMLLTSLIGHAPPESRLPIVRQFTEHLTMNVRRSLD